MSASGDWVSPHSASVTHGNDADVPEAEGGLPELQVALMSWGDSVAGHCRGLSNSRACAKRTRLAVSQNSWFHKEQEHGVTNTVP